MASAPFPSRPIAPGGDRYGTHRALSPLGSMPQSALRLDNDFTRLFWGEALLAVDTLNLDAASFAQMERAARSGEGAGESLGGAAAPSTSIEESIAHMVRRTVAERGKQQNPVTDSGGMLLGRVLQLAPGRDEESIAPGDPIATLVSLTLTPLRIDRVRAVRCESAQLDVEGEAVLFASGAYARMPDDMPQRLALAVLDVAGAAPQVARLVRPGSVVAVLGAAGKSGVLCAAEARRTGGPSAIVVGVDSNPVGVEQLRALGLCDAVLVADACDPAIVRSAVLDATRGREADVTFSCVNVPGAEMSAILVTRERGIVYFFAMSTSFTKAALGAEGVGKDVDLLIGNGYARGHAEHTLALVREMPSVRALLERRLFSDRSA
ncbi:MAG TPA: L-erythro-3,5-diaminohexanoate dehydrogenase [Polyangiaceae bacterium]|nr:L-erythro-3,5-diaminohexanoate dehydrogenase [Polyangiaceae bacterium]